MMRELSGEPSIGSSQSVRCQFGLFLCTRPMVVFEVHILVCVTTMSLPVSFLEQAISSGMSQDPKRRSEPG